MAAKNGMTLRAQWLGRELRALREAAGLRLPEAAEYIQRDGATVSRLETGLYPARTPDVQALLDLYGVTDHQRRAGLMRLAAEVWQTGWWDGYSGDLAKMMIDYAWVESRACVIRSFDALVVPGLLQTPAYMRAVIQKSDFDNALTSSGTQFRLERQRILTTEDPSTIKAVLDESVLRRVVGGPATLKEQLTHLIDMAQWPNIEIRVLPFSTGAHACLDGSFIIFEMPEPYPQVGYVDTPARGIYVEQEAMEKLILKYEQIQRDALEPRQSAEMIRAVLGTI
ncbi:helix-turn-helix transcriptional regulator [Sphaerisporangium sp. B11E5]|uniref:helix-turn-helix domain-containing protein n=1 Tax=Sphaerisporangium sp. B11E5 TaxID=3153563 RepID=UPI00325D834D